MPSKLLIAILRHRRILWICLLVAAAIMAGVLFFGRARFTNDLAYMFPRNSLSENMYRTTQDSHLTQAIQLEITVSSSVDKKAFTDKLDAIAKRLEANPLIANATAHFFSNDGDPLGDILAAIPQITSPDCLDQADPTAAVNAILKALSLPGTPSSILRQDPFGLRLPFLQRLQDFRDHSGISADISDGYMLKTTTDHLQALLLLNANFTKPPNAQQIQTLFQQIQNTVQEVLPGSKCLIISPLQHNLENEHAVRRDIRIVSLTSFIALVLLFFFVYKGSWDAIFIPLMPLLATFLATGFMLLFTPNLCLFIIGIGSGIAGLAVDQGIHVYACWQSGPLRIRRLIRLLRPLFLSVLTSVAVFLLLITTGITAYIQLGIFASLTLLLNLFLSLTLLPTLLKRNHTLQSAKNICDFHPTCRIARMLSALWLIVTVAALFAIPRLKHNFAIQTMDGTCQDTLQAEQEFQQRWRNPNAGAMIVLTAESPDAARKACELTASRLPLTIFHAASLWPSQTTRQKNLAAWHSPETQLRLATLQKELQQQCIQKNLPPNLFAPFFKAISNDCPDEPPFFKNISSYLIKQQASTTALMFTPPLAAEDTATILNNLPHNAALLTADAFQHAARLAIIPRIKRLLCYLLPVLLLALFPVLKHPLHLIVIALPGITALIFGFGLAAITNYSFTIVSIFSLVMLTGLVLDYGIFALHVAKTHEKTSIPKALVLSAATTILTMGALLASRHPVMFHTGLVLSIGIFFTAITALIFVPSLLACAPKWSKRLGFPRQVIILLALVSISCTSCMSSLTQQTFTNSSVPPALLPQKDILAFKHTFYQTTPRTYSMKTSFLWMDFIQLVVIKPNDNAIQAVGTANNGITLFSVAGTPQMETKRFFSDLVPAIAQNKLYPTLAQDLACIFTDTSNIPEIEEHYNGNPTHIVEKKRGNFPNRQWQAVYYDWNHQKGSFETIIYRNFNHWTTLTFKSL